MVRFLTLVMRRAKRAPNARVRFRLDGKGLGTLSTLRTGCGMADGTMRAWSVVTPRPVEEKGLQLVEKPVPVPGDDELLVRVRACGVCRTDLHVSEGICRRTGRG